MHSGMRRRRVSLHLKRYGEILAVLVKYGFGDILSRLNIEKFGLFPFPLKKEPHGGALHAKLSGWERLRLALEDLGPTFVKLGQFLGNRPDVFPPAFIVEMAKLQDAARPFSPSEARAIVEEEWKRPLGEVLNDFSQQPIASASIAQVHTARLQSGDEVAVKIQRPRIAETIATDTAILRHLAALAERYLEQARAFRVTRLAEEFERVIQKEIDFTIEASHIGTFRRNFRTDRRVHFPRVHSNLTTRRVLVIELVCGTKVSDIETLRAKNIDVGQIARHGTHIVLKQFFEHGFFHADPHPGNILIRDDGVICFLDCGAVGIIPPSLRYHIGVLLYGVVSRDSERIVHTLMRLSHRPIRDADSLEYDIAEFIEEHIALSLKEIRMEEVLRRFGDIIIRHNLDIIPGFYLLMKALVTFEGVAYRLDPSFSLVEHIEPYVRRLVRETPRLKFLPYDIYFTALDTASLIKHLPFELRDIVRIIKSGEMRIQFEHQGLDPIMGKADQLVNRLVFAIVVASLIIGSSIVVHADIPPKLYGISIIGLSGFVIAGILGFGLLFSILRNRRM